MEEKELITKTGDRRKRAVVLKVRSILDSKRGQLWSIGPDNTVYEAIALMAERSIGALPVVSKGELAGILTERDYARKVILQGRSSRATLVKDIMTASTYTVGLETSVDVCLRLMTRKCIRYLPVIDQGAVVGIVSMGDLVKAIVSAQAYTIDQLHNYITAGVTPGS